MEKFIKRCAVGIVSIAVPVLISMIFNKEYLTDFVSFMAIELTLTTILPNYDYITEEDFMKNWKETFLKLNS